MLRKIIYTGLIIALLFLQACKNNNEKSTSGANTEQGELRTDNTKEIALNVNFYDSRYNEVYKSYIQIKNALVESNSEETKLAAENLATAFANIGVDELLMDEVTIIIGSNDIKGQRKSFSVLSNEVAKLLSSAKIKSGKIYKQYCPMAFNFKGAYWLAAEKEIRNPYFGDQMLNCGEVKAEIE